MIPRYEKKEISQIWEEHSKFQTYLDVELALLKALEEAGRIPAGTAQTIQKNAVIDPDRIAEIEATVKHDIIAFCTSITERSPAEVSKYFHFGVTSSDILDSTLNIQIKRSLEKIVPVFERMLKTLLKRAEEVKDLPTMGRSHGMYGEPTSFGLKWLGHYAEFSRRLQDLKDYMNTELTVQFSGAVGSYTVLTPKIEARAAELLGMQVEPISTQVIPRDRLAKLINLNALIASAIERIAVEIRHLHRSEVFELHEGFTKGQKGSSTMPHKKNPISGENLTGMARMIRSHALIALENVVLWHERDISHSSTERMYLPDNLGLLYYSLERLDKTLGNLEFHNERIESRIKETYAYLSSFYLHQLLEKTDERREDLYALVQQAAFETQSSNNPEDFHSALQDQLKQKKIEVDLPTPSPQGLKDIYLGHVDEVWQRVLKSWPLP